MKSYNAVTEKVVAVAYEGGSFARGSSYRALTANNLAFWIGGRLWEVVTYERWSHMEVRLYVLLSSFLLNCHISDVYQRC